MEEIGIFIFGQTQEQIDNNYFMTSNKNKEFYNALRDKLNEIVGEGSNIVNLYITMDRGLGFTGLIAGMSINNASSKLTMPIKINTIVPNHKFTNKWDYSDALEYDRLVLHSDSVRVASQAKEFTDDDWVKAGKLMVDNSSIGIIAIPDIKPEYLKEVIRYGLGRNIPMIKVDDNLEFSEVTLVDAMI